MITNVRQVPVRPGDTGVCAVAYAKNGVPKYLPFSEHAGLARFLARHGVTLPHQHVPMDSTFQDDADKTFIGFRAICEICGKPIGNYNTPGSTWELEES